MCKSAGAIAKPPLAGHRFDPLDIDQAVDNVVQMVDIDHLDGKIEPRQVRLVGESIAAHDIGSGG